MSVSGSIPVNSGDNDARRGMPDLDPTLEIGPNLTVMLLRSDTMHLNLRFPLRAVIATDLSYARDEGWVFLPQINVDFYDRFPGPGWDSRHCFGVRRSTRQNPAPRFLSAATVARYGQG